MPHHGTQIQSLPETYELLKEFAPQRLGEETRERMRNALAEVLNNRMAAAVDDYLAEIAARDGDDRRNGSYSRHLLSSMGDLIVQVPRTRRFSAHAVIGAYKRRMADVDRAILHCFILGCSTRKVASALLPMLGERVSATTVSRVARVLDAAVEAFHQRRLKDHYRALLFDGVVLSRRTGAGAVRRPVLVALGLLSDGRKEVIDFRLARVESEYEWERFLTDLQRRGLNGETTELITVDGGKGLLNALPIVYPSIAVQRCWAHKTRNLTDKVRKNDREPVKRGLQRIYNATSELKARRAARRFASRWEQTYPRVVASLREDLDDLLSFFHFKSTDWRKWTRTTNAIERRFREVRRRTRPMGTFSDRTSIERILFAVFTYENQSQGVLPLFLVTQNS